MSELRPAIALVEFRSIAAGIRAGDAMAKRAPVDGLYAGTVQPGKYLVLVGGDTASVEEALDAARENAGEAIIDTVFLPDVHPAVLAALAAPVPPEAGEALGVVETTGAAAVIAAADAGVKGADVVVNTVRVADGLGGKGYALFTGAVSAVEVAVELAAAGAGPGGLVDTAIIARLHGDMAANLWAHPRFMRRLPGGG